MTITSSGLQLLELVLTSDCGEPFRLFFATYSVFTSPTPVFVLSYLKSILSYRKVVVQEFIHEFSFSKWLASCHYIVGYAEQQLHTWKTFGRGMEEVAFYGFAAFFVENSMQNYKKTFISLQFSILFLYF